MQISAGSAEGHGSANVRVGLSKLIEGSQNTAHGVVEAALRDCAVSQSCGQIVGEEAAEGAAQSLPGLVQVIACVECVGSVPCLWMEIVSVFRD